MIELRAGQAAPVAQDPRGCQMVPVSRPARLRRARFPPAVGPKFPMGDTSPLCIGTQVFASF